MHAEFEAEGVAFVAPDGMPGKPPVPPSADDCVGRSASGVA
jgi:hypothetical protein